MLRNKKRVGEEKQLGHLTARDGNCVRVESITGKGNLHMCEGRIYNRERQPAHV